MAISFVFDGVARTIQIAADDTDYVNNSLTFTAQQVYSAWKEWCKNGDGLQYLPAFDTLGGDPITATTLVGDYYFMRTDNGWKGLPPAKDNVIIFLQGNLYPRVPGDTVMDPLPSYTTTLIMQTSSLTQTVVISGTTQAVDVQDANIVSVNGVAVANVEDFKADVSHLNSEVYCNTESLVNGDGSQRNPFNSINDAKDYAELNNIRNIVLTGDAIIPANMKNMTIRGIGLPKIDLNGQDIKGSHFHHVQLKGTYIDFIMAQECVLLEGLNLNGFFEKCALDGNLECPDLVKTLMMDCYSNIPGLDRPTISMNGGSTSQLGVRGYHGGLTILNSTSANNHVTIEMAEGSLTFDSTNTNGILVARGLCKFVDETNGATVINETGLAANFSTKQDVYNASQI